MADDTVPAAGEYVDLIAAAVGWLGAKLERSDLLVSPLLGAGNPDFGSEPMLVSFEPGERAYVEQQCRRTDWDEAMSIDEALLTAGEVASEGAFAEAYARLQDGDEKRPLVMVLAPCLSRSRQTGYLQLQVHQLGDARELAEHQQAIRDSYPQDWIERYGLPEQVINVSDFELGLQLEGDSWSVRAAKG